MLWTRAFHELPYDSFVLASLCTVLHLAFDTELHGKSLASSRALRFTSNLHRALDCISQLCCCFVQLSLGLSFRGVVVPMRWLPSPLELFLSTPSNQPAGTEGRDPGRSNRGEAKCTHTSWSVSPTTCRRHVRARRWIQNASRP